METPTTLSDDPFTEEQIERLQRMTPQQRVAETLRLSAEKIAAERQAIAKANPLLSEQEVNLLWMEQAYGKDLADRVREYLRERDSTQATS
jgi:hypothetical protein